MRTRDKNRLWEVELENGFGSDGEDVCIDWQTGSNKIRGERLTKVKIGGWLEVILINTEMKSEKEIYSVIFGGQKFIVRLNKDGEPVIKLAWADSFTEANPMEIGKLNS